MTRKNSSTSAAGVANPAGGVIEIVMPNYQVTTPAWELCATSRHVELRAHELGDSSPINWGFSRQGLQLSKAGHQTRTERRTGEDPHGTHFLRVLLKDMAHESCFVMNTLRPIATDDSQARQAPRLQNQFCAGQRPGDHRRAV